MPYIGKDLSCNYYKIVGRGGVKTNKTKLNVEIWMTHLHMKIRNYPPSEYMDLAGKPLIVKLYGRFTDERSTPDLHNLHKVIGDTVGPAFQINDRHLSFEDAGYTTGHYRPEIVMEILHDDRG